MKVTRVIIVWSTIFLLVLSHNFSYGQIFGSKKKKAAVEAAEAEQKSDYEKFFEEKDEKVEGLFTLYKMKGKVYFEIPLHLMGREFLLGNTITSTSDNRNGIVGSMPKDPIHFRLTKQEKSIAMRIVSYRDIVAPDNPEIETALEESNIGAIYQLFKIETYNSDSTKVVVDATDLFLSDDPLLTPFDPYSLYTSGGVKRSETFQKAQSYIDEIKAFEDNVSVKSNLSYKVTISDRRMRNVPVTIAATRSIMLLDSIAYQPRITDSRIAIFPTSKMLYSTETTGVKPLYYAERWRLEPSDVEAYKRGELVEPVKPIVFYIDNNFPATWLPYVKEGVNQWSELFEEIGFKNAIRAEVFPEDDPEFDPDNIKYSCVRYAPIPIQNAMGPSWTDPRSGEIISASVYLYHDVVELINNWIFVQTAPVDKRVRKVDIPQEIVGDALRYVLSHEIGHCLGFMHNMSASYVVPVDSLRSPSYTQQHGTTTSIMDYARFNYVAQPGDFERGVKLMPPRFGEYDRFLIDWSYRPHFIDSPEREYREVTSKILQESSANPIYRYGVQQFYGELDPRSLTEDLGDDHVRASEYGVRNLKYLMEHLNEWVGEEDRDFQYRKSIYSGVVNQMYRYLNHVISYIGGVNLFEKHEGDQVEGYISTPRAKQIEAVNFIMKQLEELDWLDNREVTSNLGLLGSAADLLRGLMLEATINAAKGVDFSAVLDRETPFTVEECMDIIYGRVWNPTTRWQKLTQSQMMMQRLFVTALAKDANLNISLTNSKSLTLGGDPIANIFDQERGLVCGACCSARDNHKLSKLAPIMGYDGPEPFFYETPPMKGLALDYLMKIKKTISAQVNHQDRDTRLHYSAMLHAIETSLK